MNFKWNVLLVALSKFMNVRNVVIKYLNYFSSSFIYERFINNSQLVSNLSLYIVFNFLKNYLLQKQQKIYLPDMKSDFVCMGKILTVKRR